MVDNAFKLSLDLVFPPPLSWQNSKKHYLPNRPSTNLFEVVFDECSAPREGIVAADIVIEMG
jgi:hypothetical protein